jgi:hypothetical protein
VGQSLSFLYPTNAPFGFIESVNPAQDQGCSQRRTNPLAAKIAAFGTQITMSAMDIVSTVTILISLGSEIKNRLDSLNQAAEELQLLTTNLTHLLKVFESLVNEDIFKTNALQFVPILDLLESIARSCRECAKALDIDLAGATTAAKTESRGKKLVKRLRAFSKISDLLAEIQRKAEHLQQIYSMVSVVFLQDIRVRQGRTSGKETVESAVVQKPTIRENLLDLDLSTDFANIDRMVGDLMKECEYLRQRLREATLFPDTSAVQHYQAQNPEAASFWKDRFQKDELNASTLRYEVRTLKLTPPPRPSFSPSLFLFFSVFL